MNQDVNKPQGQQEPTVTPTLEAMLNGNLDFPAPSPVQSPDQQGTPDPQGTPPPANTLEAEPSNQVQETDEISALLSGNPALLTPEDRLLRQNVFDNFGAASIDSAGNLLDINGNVVLSKSNFDNYINTGELLLDAEGNQVDETGKVIKDASSLASAVSFINESRNVIEQELGYELLDAEGKPKVYDNSIEGNTALLKDVADTATINAVSSFLNANPTLKDVYYHIANGGNIEDYSTSNIDYGAVDVTSLDRNQMLHYIKSSLDKQGVKNASSLIKTLEQASDEVLTQNTADAILALKQLSEEDKTAREQQYLQAVQEERQELENYWEGVKSVITKGNLKDINIPVGERDSFFKYLAVPVNSNGESQEMLDAAKEDNEFSLMLSYLRYKKYDLGKLIETRAKTNKLESLRSRVGVPNPKIENAQARTNSQAQSVATGFPTLDQLTNR